MNATQANEALRSHYVVVKTAKIEGDIQILPRWGLALANFNGDIRPLGGKPIIGANATSSNGRVKVGGLVCRCVAQEGKRGG